MLAGQWIKSREDEVIEIRHHFILKISDAVRSATPAIFQFLVGN